MDIYEWIHGFLWMDSWIFLNWSMIFENWYSVDYGITVVSKCIDKFPWILWIYCMSADFPWSFEEGDVKQAPQYIERFPEQNPE